LVIKLETRIKSTAQVEECNSIYMIMTFQILTTRLNQIYCLVIYLAEVGLINIIKMNLSILN